MTPAPRQRRRPRLEGIHANALYPAKTMLRLLGLGWKSRANLKRMGLRLIPFGRGQLVIGADVLAVFQRLAEQQSKPTVAAGEGTADA